MTVEISLSESMSDYLASPELSSHKLGDFATRGPRWYAMMHVAKRGAVSGPKSDAFIFGDLFESLVQGRALSLDHLVLQPPGLHKGEGARARAAAWKAANAHRTVVTQEELDDLRYMHEALLDSKRACELITACAQQVTLRSGGLKSRPDWACVDGHELTAYAPFSVDLKTCQSIEQISSGRAVRDYKYHVQASMVQRLQREHSGTDTVHYLLAVEKTPPYRVQVVRMTQEWLDIGHDWADRQIAAIRECERRGEWPRVMDEETVIAPPPRWLVEGT